MKTAAPKNRRKFTTVWDEVNYLYNKLLYWFYDQQDRRKALPFAERLEKLLERLGSAEKQVSTVGKAQAVRHRPQ